MAKVIVQVDVSKELHEVGVLLADVAKAIAAKKSLMQIAAEELVALERALAGVDQIPAEIKEDPAASVMAVAIPLASALDAILKKPAAAPAEAPVAAPTE